MRERNQNNILLVEDEDIIALAGKYELVKEGYRVITAASGEDAVDIVCMRKEPVDIILMDIDLGEGMDGTEAAVKILEEYDIPVVFLSSHMDKGIVQKTENITSYGYVVKNSGITILDASIKMAFKLFNANKDLKTKENELEITKNRLYRANGELELLFNSIANIIIGVSKDDRITHWNVVAESVFGIPKENIIGKQFVNCGIDWDWSEIYVGISDSLSDGKLVTIPNVSFVRSDGIKGILGITINPLRHNPNEEVKGFIILGMDFTEQRLLENQLMQVRKLEAIGQLTSGISHEINSPMQYICDNLDFLKSKMAYVLSGYKKHSELLRYAKEVQSLTRYTDEIIDYEKQNDISFIIDEIPVALDDVEDGTERIKKIIIAMKKFSHPGAAGKTLTNINNVISDTVTISRNEWKYVADVDLKLDEQLPVIPCIESEFNQVILNLIINARDTINDAIAEQKITHGLIRISTRLKNDAVEISISDNGCGIPESIRTKIFDPFFTTKEVGKGTGQGLAISHTIIVKDLGGSIMFESVEGQGTTFIIRLPLR